MKTARRLVLRGTRSDEGGFSLIEMAIAIALFALIASFTTNLLASGMRGVLLSKRREVATGETNKVIEFARSLSYSTLGLIQTDSTIPTDGAIQMQGGAQSYKVGATWEPIIWASSAAGHPYNPHVLSFARGSTTLTRSVYVTGVDSNADGTIDLKRVTVVVSWNNAGTTGGVNSVRAQTLVNPNGVIATAGLVPQTSSTNSSGGSATVANGHGNLGLLLNALLPTTPVTVQLPTTSGTNVYKAVTSINCTGKSASLVGLTGTPIGGHSVSVTADDDAQTATPSQPADSVWLGTPADLINGLDDVDNLVVESSITSPVSCHATGQDSVTGLPYENGTASGPGSLNLTTDLTGANLGVGTNTLSALVVSPLPVAQSIAHQTVGGAREVLSTASAGQGVLSVLKIPTVLPNGLVSVDAISYSASVRSAAGTPSQAPTITAPNPIVIHIYDPASSLTGCVTPRVPVNYCNINVNPLAGGFSGLSKHPSGTTILNLGLTTLAFDVQVNAFPPATDLVNGVTGPNGERRWSAHYTPISINAHLTVTVKVGIVNVVLTDTVVHVDFGTVSASACAGVTC